MTTWTPANQLEQAMADALAAGDGPQYARLLRSARLLVPELPEPDTEEEAQVAELLPPGAPYVPVFTSRESMVLALGDLARGHEEIAFAALLQRWPDNQHQLAVNPGSPIGTFLPPQAVADLADGKVSLAPIPEIQQAMADEALGQIRRICLAELAGRQPSRAGDDIPELRDDPPANPLEASLREAAARPDGDAYLQALLAGAAVIVPTASPVADPELIFEDDFPWRVLGGDQARVIPVFTSAAMLERTGAAATPSIPVSFLHVLVNWPDEEHQLYINPGSVVELLLPGDTVIDVAVSVADSVET